MDYFIALTESNIERNAIIIDKEDIKWRVGFRHPKWTNGWVITNRKDSHHERIIFPADMYMYDMVDNY